MTDVPRLAIVRSYGGRLALDRYNVQELGLAAALNELGVSVEVFMRGGSEEQSSVYHTAGQATTTLHLLPAVSGPGGQAVYPGLRRKLAERECDIIQVHEDSQITSWLVATWAHRRGLDVVLSQGMYQDYQGAVPHALQSVYDRVFQRSLRGAVNRCIAKTDAARGYLQQKGFGDITVLPVGLDPRQFASRADRDWRAELGVGEKTPLLLYVGRMQPARRLDVVFDALAELNDGGSAVHMAVIGSGPLEPAWRQHAERRLPGRVHWMGVLKQESLPSLYEAADLLVLPTGYEIYGMVALEALFFGAPVMASSVGGLKDILGSSPSGILVPSNTVGDWSLQLRSFLATDPDRRRGMRAAAERSAASLTWTALAPRYLEFYRRPQTDWRRRTDSRRTG